SDAHAFTCRSGSQQRVRSVEEDGITPDAERRAADGARIHGEAPATEAAGAGDRREGASHLDLHPAAPSGVADRNQVLSSLQQPEAGSRKPAAGSRQPEAGSGKPEAGSGKPEADGDTYHSQYGIHTSISPFPRLFHAKYGTAMTPFPRITVMPP